MGWKYRLSPAGMVVYTLNMAGGTYLSVKEIQQKILETFEYKTSRQTIAAAIAENDYVSGLITEKKERRGWKRQPTSLYAINPKEDLKKEDI